MTQPDPPGGPMTWEPTQAEMDAAWSVTPGPGEVRRMVMAVGPLIAARALREAAQVHDEGNEGTGPFLSVGNWLRQRASSLSLPEDHP